MADGKSYLAIVDKVVADGPHGPYAVGKSKEMVGFITFSLTSPTWQEDEWPENGMYVVLSKLRKKRAGWRARSGRFLQPSDEKPSETRNHKPAESTEDTE